MHADGLPLTTRVVLWLVAPAWFDTEHVYSPLCSALTDSMSKALLRLLIDIIMSGLSCVFIGSPLKYHENSIGLSPTETEHVADIDSPELTALSPNVKGTICGATGYKDNFIWNDLLK